MDKKDRMFFKEVLSRFAKKLDESFTSIHIKLNLIMTRQSDFDAALAKLKPAIDQVKSDFEAYKNEAAAQGLDLTDEETTLETSLSALTDLHTEVSGGTTSSTGTSSTDASSTGASSTDASSANTGSASSDPTSSEANNATQAAPASGS
jgi:hypothetical protein